jgi:hypothetical protein
MVTDLKVSKPTTADSIGELAKDGTKERAKLLAELVYYVDLRTRPMKSSDPLDGLPTRTKILG